MVLREGLHQYIELLMPTILIQIQCISRPKVIIFLTLVFLLLSSKVHGLNYENLRSLGRINIVLTLVLLLLSPKFHGLKYKGLK